MNRDLKTQIRLNLRIVGNPSPIGLWKNLTSTAQGLIQVRIEAELNAETFKNTDTSVLECQD